LSREVYRLPTDRSKTLIFMQICGIA
jgi:hypothetical protein